MAENCDQCEECDQTAKAERSAVGQSPIRQRDHARSLHCMFAAHHMDQFAHEVVGHQCAVVQTL